MQKSICSLPVFYNRQIASPYFPRNGGGGGWEPPLQWTGQSNALQPQQLQQQQPLYSGAFQSSQQQQPQFYGANTNLYSPLASNSPYYGPYNYNQQQQQPQSQQFPSLSLFGAQPQLAICVSTSLVNAIFFCFLGNNGGGDLLSSLGLNLG